MKNNKLRTTEELLENLYGSWNSWYYEEDKIKIFKMK